MPYIETKVNIKISPAQEIELKEKLGKIIENFPGKTENWLMLNFEDNCRMYFKGDNKLPIAYVEVKLFGKLDETASENMTQDICTIFEDILDIPKTQIYVKYEGVGVWGWNGSNF